MSGAGRGGEKPSETRYEAPRLRRAAMRVLARETEGTPPTSEALAAAAGRLLDTLCQRLGEVIGPAGVQSIFLRAIKLRKSEFALFDECRFPGDTLESLAEALRACLQTHEPDVIRGVSVTLFATFVGLLENVIGDMLTWSLLQQIWPDVLLSRTELQETENDG